MSIDKPPVLTQRAQDIQQLQLSGQSESMLAQKRAEASERLRRDKIRHERDDRRRHFEHQHQQSGQKDESEEDTGFLDVVV